MRRLIGAVVLLAGCASTNEYVPGPPTTVREPTFSGQVRPREPSFNGSALSAPRSATARPTYAPAADPLLPPPEPQRPLTGRFSEWLYSGRGWVWGAARRGPIRDEGLDRLMVDTLTSGRPGYSRDSAATSAPPVPEPWVYPSPASSGGFPRSPEAVPAGGPYEPFPRSDAGTGHRALGGVDEPIAPTPTARPRESTSPQRPRSRENWQPAGPGSSDLP